MLVSPRRLLGDLHWAHDTSFAQLLDYMPTSVAALRTCKSGVLVGCARETEAAAPAARAPRNVARRRPLRDGAAARGVSREYVCASAAILERVHVCSRDLILSKYDTD